MPELKVHTLEKVEVRRTTADRIELELNERYAHQLKQELEYINERDIQLVTTPTGSISALRSRSCLSPSPERTS